MEAEGTREEARIFSFFLSFFFISFICSVNVGFSRGGGGPIKFVDLFGDVAGCLGGVNGTIVVTEHGVYFGCSNSKSGYACLLILGNIRGRRGVFLRLWIASWTVFSLRSPCSAERGAVSRQRGGLSTTWFRIRIWWFKKDFLRSIMVSPIELLPSRYWVLWKHCRICEEDWGDCDVTRCLRDGSLAYPANYLYAFKFPHIMQFERSKVPTVMNLL